MIYSAKHDQEEVDNKQKGKVSLEVNLSTEKSIRYKEVVSNIINQSIIAFAKHSFKQVTKDQVVTYNQ